MTTTSPPPPAAGRTISPTMVIDRRIVAFLIDLGLIVTLTVMAFGAVADFDFTELDDLSAAEAFCEERSGDGFCLPSQTGAMVVVFTRIASPLVFHTCLWLLRGVMEGALGWTPGKRIAKVRVVDAGGESIGVAKGLIRAVLLVFDGFPWGAPMLVGLLIASNSKRQQRLGDLATDSYVVHEAAVGTFISTPVTITTPLPDPTAVPVASAPDPHRSAPAGSHTAAGQTATPPNGGGRLQPGPVVMPTSPPVAAETLPLPATAPSPEPPQGMIFDEAQQRWTWVEGDAVLVWDEQSATWRNTDS